MTLNLVDVNGATDYALSDMTTITVQQAPLMLLLQQGDVFVADASTNIDLGVLCVDPDLDQTQVCTLAITCDDQQTDSACSQTMPAPAQTAVLAAGDLPVGSYTITVTATKPAPAGSSSSAQARTASDTVQVTIVSGTNVPYVVVRTDDARVHVNTDQRLSLVSEVMVGGASVTNLPLLWSSEPNGASGAVLDLSAAGVLCTAGKKLADQLSGPALCITEGVLAGGASYTFKLTAGTAPNTGYGSVTITTNSPPSGGSLTVTPTSGVANVDEFTLAAPNWYESVGPMVYEFGYRDDLGSFVPISGPQDTNSFKTMLPIPANDETTLVLVVRVIDESSAFAEATTEVTLSMPTGLVGASPEGIVQFWTGELTSETVDPCGDPTGYITLE